MTNNSNKSANVIKGAMGEDLAVDFLLNKGFHVKERNFRRKWGELDIICEKDGLIHFVEVKSIVSHENTSHLPEENVHGLKLRKMRRMIETYIWEQFGTTDVPFACDVVAIQIIRGTDERKILFIENIVP